MFELAREDTALMITEPSLSAQRTVYQQQAEAQLESFGQRLEALEADARRPTLTPEQRTDLRERIQFVRQRLHAALQAYQHVRTSHGNEWVHETGEFEDAVQDVEQAFGQVRALLPEALRDSRV
jgi:hypothetical protein